jgi:dTDP-L-rhamnose 4-epimerase
MPRSVSRVLVTGGAGFIGSHTVDLLLKEGFEVLILDNLEEQVHGGRPPSYLNPEAKLVVGDVRDRALLRRLVEGVDAIIHLAAAVGVGQSMYGVEKYIDYNTRGTATLLDVLVNEEHGVRKLIVASSMSIYGEGKYYCESCREAFAPSLRSLEQLRRRLWEHICPRCGSILAPAPTDEEKPLKPASVYAQSKRHQEELSLLIGSAYGLPAVSLRYFNVYGPRQSLSNPYTGVCAIFISRLLNRKPPYLFEDGGQLRDFIHVSDVAKANLKALESSSCDYQAINVGTGRPTSIKRVAQLLAEALGVEERPLVSQRFRVGDVRHCYADTSRAERLLGFKASLSLEDGLRELASTALKEGWGAQDRFEQSLKELEERGLVG